MGLMEDWMLQEWREWLDGTKMRLADLDFGWWNSLMLGLLLSRQFE